MHILVWNPINLIKKDGAGMKKVWLLLVVMAMAAMAAGCKPVVPIGTPGIQPSASATPVVTASESPTPSATPSATPASPSAGEAEAQLAALLPDEKGYEWQYEGSAEYGHTMTLRDVRRQQDRVEYDITGEVADMSAGESGRDHSFTIVYTIADGALRQRSQGTQLLDSQVPQLELLRLPLQQGATWSQEVTDADGRTLTLDCTITSAQTVEGRGVYHVDYRADDDSYFERREFTQGIGVTRFERQFGDPQDNFTVGYALRTEPAAVPAGTLEDWLPPLNQKFTFFGLAEYGHKGSLSLKTKTSEGAIYLYSGQYADGRGLEEKFSVEYHLNNQKGTVTERVVNSGRGTPDINSRLHNLVLVRLPLDQGASWSHSATLGGSKVTVRATITELDLPAGVMTVRYIAEGVPGYFRNTYEEQRTYEKGLGMVAFSCLLPGDIGLSEADAKDEAKVREAIAQHSFGYQIRR